jgi:hypothetical protein
MRVLREVVPSGWWSGLLHPGEAGRLVLDERHPGWTLRLAALIAALYAVYGVSMGLFTSPRAGAVSGLKALLLLDLTQAVCFPAFYVINCRSGLAFSPGQCVRLLLMAASANAAALASYAPVSYFFTLTTSDRGYAFLVFMHVAVFAVAGLLSVGVVSLVFRAAAAGKGLRVGAATAWAWGVLYGVVGAEMSWSLRPWIGWPGEPYALFKGAKGSFLESMGRVIPILFQ